MTPTSRSLKFLRDDGWTAEVVEIFNSFTKQRKDLFGFADIIAVKDGEKPMLVQTTSGSNFTARRTKILEHEKYPLVQSSFTIVVHGWRKLKLKRGGKAMRWRCRVEVMKTECCGEQMSREPYT